MTDFSLNPYSSNKENLKSLSREQSLILERRLLELFELLELIKDNMLSSFGEPADIYEQLAFFSEEYSGAASELHSENLPENREILERYMNALGVNDKCFLCEMLVGHGTDVKITEQSYISNENSGEVFTYVKNPISDEAYDVFTEDLSDPRVFYSKSFKDAVQMVEDGSVDFCLLPLEEKGDRIHTVNELILSHDLKINGVTPVFGLDGMADMKYAKVGRHLYLPSKNNGDDRYLEIRLPSDTEISLGQIISAAEVFGNSVYRINTETLRKDGRDKNYYSIVFRDNEVGFAKILTYLTLFTGDYITVGIYKNLE